MQQLRTEYQNKKKSMFQLKNELTELKCKIKALEKAEFLRQIGFTDADFKQWHPTLVTDCINDYSYTCGAEYFNKSFEKLKSIVNTDTFKKDPVKYLSLYEKEFRPITMMAPMEILMMRRIIRHQNQQ